MLFQCWFNIDGDLLERTLDAVRNANPEATLDFIDGFAPNDLRLARHVDPYIRFYLKKSLFKDRSEHARVWRGDTNLTEYAADLFELDTASVDYGVPETILPKLRLSPGPATRWVCPRRRQRPFSMGWTSSARPRRQSPNHSVSL